MNIVDDTIVKTNIYRCLEHCLNCPFLDNGLAMSLKSDRLDSIKSKLRESDAESFLCHKTIYNLNNEMKNSEQQDLKMCKGAYDYLKRIEKPNIAMRLALSLKIDN